MTDGEKFADTVMGVLLLLLFLLVSVGIVHELLREEYIAAALLVALEVFIVLLIKEVKS